MVHFLALCWSVWLNGWNDGTLGPLLPRIQTDYRIGFAIVSLLFIGNCSGYVTGAALNIWFNERYGLGKVIVGGALFQLVGYVIMIPAPPFPMMILAYVIIGFGISLQSAQANGFVGSLDRHMTYKLGVLHASYGDRHKYLWPFFILFLGLGAFTSPFASTYFSNFTSSRWAFHFIISAGLAVMNILLLIYVFRFRRQEDLLAEAGQEPNAESTMQPSGSTYKQIFRLKAMPFLTIFALIYIGVEVTLGGWIVTFIIRERHGGSNAGYISSGFFGGLTAGRICLMWLNQMVGERRIIFVYSLVAISLELTIWFVPSIIGNAVAVSLIGVVLGPMFPLLVSHMTHILPQWLLTGCVGLVAGIGMAGSAALPFVTGLLASKYGIGSLQPLMVSMMSCMVLVWALVPNARRID
ncbi:MFS general substrate transporter [Pholiota conissans]|uniref:MFS general substrate transporter n=1 Tax=Pholiota conissans TaxID=109636 RepID=A0A9P6D3P5_9AGAR|nr:MFS general substrate transporter [Pholiota conissans]